MNEYLFDNDDDSDSESTDLADHDMDIESEDLDDFSADFELTRVLAERAMEKENIAIVDNVDCTEDVEHQKASKFR